MIWNFFVPICHVYDLFWWCSWNLYIFNCPILTQLLSYNCSLGILDTVSLSDIFCYYFLPVYGLLFHLFVMSFKTCFKCAHSKIQCLLKSKFLILIVWYTSLFIYFFRHWEFLLCFFLGILWFYFLSITYF